MYGIVRCSVFIPVFAFCLVFLFRFPSYADVVASSSDAPFEASSNLPEDMFEAEGSEVSVEVYSSDDAGSPLAIVPDNLVNCVRFDVRISGTDYILLLPSVYESSVMVDADGYLWNMTASQIQGRLFRGSFSPTADTGILLYLAPCLGNNFQTNRDYGSPNYIRNYYWSSNRLTYTTTYVTVQVEKSYHLYQSGDLLRYVLIFLAACSLICLWKRAAR